MKCSVCQRDSKLKDRSGGLCSGCGAKFAFEPRSGDKLTDVAFADAIKRVSSDGEVWWGVEHLYYEVARRLHKKRASVVAMAVFLAATVGGLAALMRVPIWGALLLTVAVGVAIFRIESRRRNTVAIEPTAFDALWRRWNEAHGPPHRLITRRPQAALESPRTLDPDIASYSFDRAVICDRARTVDLLLSNNFHFENNCAVLSVGGYPAATFHTVRAMLKNNPRIEVSALHDATPAGCALARRISQDPEWFDGKVRVTDVGLRPSQAAGFGGVWQRQPVPALDRAALDGLSASELDWLGRGWIVELAAIRPEQVIKRLYRAMSARDGSDNASVGDGGVDYHDPTVMMVAATMTDGGGDSFG